MTATRTTGDMAFDPARLTRETRRLPVTASFTITGNPVPKERARTGGGHHYTPTKTVDAENTVAWLFRAAARGHHVDTVNRFGVMALFALPDRRHRDTDNLLKLILDALNGVCWGDDSQVDEHSARKIVVPKGDAHTDIVIYRTT